MASSQRLSTRTLLICAALAVVTGVVSAIAGWVSGPTIAAVPVLYGLVLTAHALPGILAQVVLRQPWVALITHLLAALVASAVNPLFVLSYLSAVVLMGGIQEGWAAIGRYQRWSIGWLAIGGAILGAVLGLTAGLIIGLKYLPWWGAMLSVLLTVVGGVLWTLVAEAIGRALHRAGLTRTYRA
ncbi:ECF transporter S component [Microbacterium gorillae]|uniref:ECF transporter S component n=1 Tax=Microbacterium gorillae TaxID=1231063 RepID=UPI00058F7790|nr:ECF transporter S component [Microbacterium gorillae]